MDTFENKIKRIRSTIDDIRGDIDSMKFKNEKTLTNIMGSINNLATKDKCNTRNKDAHREGLTHRPNNGNMSVLSEVSLKNRQYSAKKENNIEEGESYQVTQKYPARDERGYTTNYKQNPHETRFGQRTVERKDIGEPWEDRNTSFEQVEDNIAKRYERVKSRPPMNCRNNRDRTSSIHRYSNYSYDVSNNNRNTNNNYSDNQDNFNFDYGGNSETIRENRSYTDRRKQKADEEDRNLSPNTYNEYVNAVPGQSRGGYQDDLGQRLHPTRKDLYEKERSYEYEEPSRNKLKPSGSAYGSKYSQHYKTKGDRQSSSITLNTNEIYRTNHTNNTEILEKQVGELNHIVSDLQKKNTILQSELNKSRTREDYEDAEPRSYRGEKIHSRNHSYSLPPQNTREKVSDWDQSKRNQKSSDNVYSTLRNTRERNIKDEYEGFANEGGIYEQIVGEIRQEIGPSVPLVEVASKFREYMRTFKMNKIRDEFIEKMTGVYCSLTGAIEKNVEIKQLWRWMKNLIKTSKGAERDYDEYSSQNRIYRDLCENIIKEYCLKDINELRTFINELLNKNMKNRKRVEKIKKLLLTEPQNASRYSNNESTTNFNDHI